MKKNPSADLAFGFFLTVSAIVEAAKITRLVFWQNEAAVLSLVK